MELVKQKAYRNSFDLACARLSALDLERQLVRAGLDFAMIKDRYTIPVPFFDETIQLTVPGFTFTSLRGSNVTLVARIIILHYIITASGATVGGELIPYEDIPGCRSYLPVFEKRVTRALISAFGYARDAFLAAGEALGGKAEEYGSASFTVQAFPRVPMTFILWEGEEGFPPSVRVLFDRSIDRYLPLEDIVVVGKMAATRILKQARKTACAESQD